MAGSKEVEWGDIWHNPLGGKERKMLEQKNNNTSEQKNKNTLEQTESKGMSLIVKTITRLTVGLILLYGIYIVLHGHISPGGGFAGGVIIALSFIHLMLAFGKEEVFKRFSSEYITFFEGLGATLFLGIAILGFLAGYFFLDFFVDKGAPFNLFSAGNIPLYNIAIGIKVSSGLFAIFVFLVLLRVIKDKDKQ